MTGEALEPTFASRPEHAQIEPELKGEAGSQRAASGPGDNWVAALTVAPFITEPLYLLATRALGADTAPAWRDFSGDLMRRAIAEPGPAPDTYVVRGEELPRLERALAELGGPDVVRNLFVDAWRDDDDPALVPEIVAWARQLQRWQVLAKIWLAISDQTDTLSIETLETFRDLPVPARAARPNLTWASAAAASDLTQDPSARVAVAWDRVLLDSAMLHADWASREDTDDAVIAGTFRMIGEQRQPGTRVGQSLDAAWRTKQTIDEFIDARSREGRGAGRRSQAVFRAFSARLALSRYDPLSAINEARWATMLSDWEPASILAAGLEALALSVSTGEGLAGLEVQPSDLRGLAQGVGLRRIGRIYLTIAASNLALRALDRDRTDHFLGLVSSQTSALAGAWTFRASTAATRAALWGDPTDGLDVLADEIARLSRVGSEQDEPIGQALLARAKIALLIKVGAFAAATDNVAALPERFRVPTQARILLWSGKYTEVIALADAALYEPALEIGERHTLSLVRAAAGLLNNDLDDDLRALAARELQWLVEDGAFVHLAMLPRVAREALIGLFHPGIDPPDSNLSLLLQRLEQLNDAGIQGPGPVRLTDRERLLLPLLATRETVPEIARKLQVSVNTVRKQVATLRQKFEADTRAELIRKARLRGDIR